MGREINSARSIPAGSHVYSYNFRHNKCDPGWGRISFLPLDSINIRRLWRQQYLKDLYILMSSHPGRCDVLLDLTIDGVDVHRKSEAGRVAISRALESQLEARGCSVTWI